jgi:hypothetical protein
MAMVTSVILILMTMILWGTKLTQLQLVEISKKEISMVKNVQEEKKEAVVK